MADLSYDIDVNVRKALKGIDDLQNKLKKTNKTVEASGKAFGKFKNVLSTLATGVVIKGIVKLSDTATDLTNKLKLVTNSIEETNDAFDTVIRISKNTRTPLEAVSTTFFRLARASDDLGISQDRVANITKTLSQAVTSSGLSAQEASGPLLQLSQAFQSGRLAGDEFRSVAEGLPQVLTALSRHLGVPKGALKELASEGKITGQVLVAALEGAASTIGAEFAKTTATIGQAMTVLSTSSVEFINELDKATGTSKSISDGIILIAESMDTLAQYSERVAVLIKGVIGVFLALGAGKIFKILSKGVLKLSNAFAALNKAILSGTSIWVAFKGLFTPMINKVKSLWGWIKTLFGISKKETKEAIGWWNKLTTAVRLYGANITNIISRFLRSFPLITAVVGSLSAGFAIFFDTVSSGWKWIIEQAVVLKDHIHDILWALGMAENRPFRDVVIPYAPGFEPTDKLFDNLPTDIDIPVTYKMPELPKVDTTPMDAHISQWQDYNEEVRQTTENFLPLKTATAEYNRNVEKLNYALKKGMITNKEHAKAMSNLNHEYAEFAGIIPMVNDELDEQEEKAKTFAEAWKDAFKEYKDAAFDAANEAKTIFNSVAKSMEDAIYNFAKTGKMNFKDFASSVIDDMLRIQSKKLAANILGGSGVGSGSLFSGWFAGGGVIPQGRYGVVGEAGPELVQGPANVSKPTGGNVTYNIQAVDAPSFQAMIARDPAFLYAVTEQGRNTLPSFG